MKNLNLLSFLLVALPFFSCQKEIEIPSQLSEEGQLYFNATIYTVDDQHPWAEAFFVKDGVIEKIGSSVELLREVGEGVDKIDLRGNFVMPGIHDVHVHPLEASSDNFQFILNNKTTDPEKYALDIKKAYEANPDSEWILGWGFDIYTLLESKRPPVEILDEISTTKPIAVMELTSHSIWCNSKALKLAGITENSVDPIGGVVMREKDGTANGILFDNAGNILIDLAVSTIPNNEDNDFKGLIDFGLPELSKNGITSICDARTYWKRNHHKTWQRIENEGKLTVRANLGLWAYPTENDESQIQTLKTLYSFNQESLVKVNQIKLYSDGIIINTTSAMQENYKFDLFNKTSNNGLNYFTQERIAKYLAALDPIGFDFHVHAIGDRGIKEVLNAIAQSGGPKARHRITHVEFVDPSDYSRFKALNVTADCQVAGDFTQPSSWSENDEFISMNLTKNVIPLKLLQNAGARLTLSSDWDVSDLNPFVGMQNAVTRVPQELAITEVIKAYTIHPAYVMRQENRVGSISIGKDADFIVTNQNILKVTPSKIGQTKVLQTYLQGKNIYKL